jgi:hypothetical protein
VKQRNKGGTQAEKEEKEETEKIEWRKKIRKEKGKIGTNEGRTKKRINET